MTGEDIELYRGMIEQRDKRIQELEAAVRFATYKDENAVRGSWHDSKDLAVMHPVLLAVHNG